MPLLGRLPRELKVAGSLIVSGIIAAALLASASRLGSAAGVVGMILGLLLWSRHRHVLRGHSVWPVYLVLAGALIAATWYGFLPLAERLVATDLEEGRLEVFGLMLSEFPARWWLHGVGLGGFEAVFKQVQPGHITTWYDYAHNDLLQWLVEMGIVGAALLVAVAAGLWRAAHLSIERIALYAGLAALALVALGDFSWHIPATQIVLALFLGTLLKGDRFIS
jgi:putative inorganic carbon (hco3(-)) transporter